MIDILSSSLNGLLNIGRFGISESFKKNLFSVSKCLTVQILFITAVESLRRYNGISNTTNPIWSDRDSNEETRSNEWETKEISVQNSEIFSTKLSNDIQEIANNTLQIPQQEIQELPSIDKSSEVKEEISSKTKDADLVEESAENESDPAEDFFDNFASIVY